MPPGDNLTVELAPSYTLGALLAAGHALALWAAWTGFDNWARWLVAAGILLSAGDGLASALHLSRSSARAITLRADGGCAWRDGAGAWRETRMAGAPYVSALLIVVGLRVDWLRRKWVVVLPDAADGDSRRRLRAWLLWRPPPGAHPEGRGE